MTGTFRRSRKQPVRAAAVSSRLENLTLDADPLGPLGGSQGRPDSSSGAAGDTQRAIDDMGPSTTDAFQRTPRSQRRGELASTNEHSPSVPREQAASPTFHIIVGDPVKIGDLTSAHTVYKVSTRTTSQAFKAPECSVTRRYRDFLWLYDQLNRSSPGAIVPPPPEKQAMGRFSENFVEARRFALERMLEKIGKHPVLCNEADFKLFLESETFSQDVKHRPVDSRTAQEHSRGFLGLGSAFSIAGKFIETDEFFDQKRAQFDLLDSQLKHLSKAVDVVIKQRRDLAHTTSEFGAALSALSTVELSRSLSNALGSLSDLQLKIQELHERQAQQDLLTLGHTVEEYQRLIGSVKTAMNSRQKAWLAWQDADAEASKRRHTSDKMKRQAKTQQDRLNQVDAEMSEAERKAHALKLQFEQVGRLLRQELTRFEMDKVEDFKTSLEMFLESAVEAQKEVIEHWEFYHTLLIEELEEDLVPEASSAGKAKNEGTASAPATNEGEAAGSADIPDAASEERAEAQNGAHDEAMNEAEETDAPAHNTLPIQPRPNTADTSIASMPSPGLAPIPADEANPFARPSTSESL
jgi:sorting nexin-1/2